MAYSFGVDLAVVRADILVQVGALHDRRLLDRAGGNGGEGALGGVERHHGRSGSDQPRHAPQVRWLARVLSHALGIRLEAQVTSLRRQRTVRRASVMTGAGLVKGVDRSERRIVARPAVVAMHQHLRCAGHIAG
ncbi:hypothetical protein Mext_0453 [Methylorubrum extorquens PA1]|nr:hypothetical protein Mext_0453 [Methylorubrum extorquens PA1]